MRNMVILHCGGPRVDILLFERPSLALKLPLVLYAGSSRICKCVLCVQFSDRQHSGKETKYEGERAAGRL